MDSDEGEGESINEARWRDGGRFMRSKTAERLSTSPHYCLRELSGRGGGLGEEGKCVRLGGVNEERAEAIFNTLARTIS